MPPLETPELTNNFIAPSFNLLGIDGKYSKLEEIKGPKGLVVAFICNHCPYVKAIADKIAKEALELKKLGINFVGINSNDPINYPEDSFDKMKLFAEEHNYNFPYLFDESQEIAKAYGAVCTPDFFGFNSDLLLLYRGRLDAAGKNFIPEARRDLFLAMEKVSQDLPLDEKQYPSLGCSIKWKV
jgi:peroxiredoxin